MSFGFIRHHQNISYMIDDVIRKRKQHVLLFAAAGNGGKNSDREFPARHRDVFSVHSTDHHGNYSTFDTGVENEIAIPGEGIAGLPSAPLMSGTSIATPIAAAICALVLDAARDCASDDDSFRNTNALGKYHHLCTLNGMEKVLSLEPFTPKSDTGSRCLDPRVFSSYDKAERRGVFDYAVNLIQANAGKDD
jgi:hypothetical protein